MSTLEKIKSKVISIDIDELKEIIKLELDIPDTEKANKLLEISIYKTLLIVLDMTNREKIINKLYGTWMDMIKDYWVLNKYDKKVKQSEDEEEDYSDNLEVSSIKEGDTQVSFSQKSNTTNINGTTYSTGTINFDENILREKYKKDLYRHRVMRWG